jgi:DNA-binding transcriptional ArsR family regulator
MQDLTQLDRVIHEPARLMIMMILRGVGEADFLYLQREAGLTQGNLSSHLARLEETGYVLFEKSFKGKFPLTICRLTAKGEEAFAGYADTLLGALRNGAKTHARKREAAPSKYSKD